MAEVTRTTQAGKVLVATGDPPVRVTQAGKVLVLAVPVSPPIRVTQAGKVLVLKGGIPQPSILSVSDATHNDAKVTSSAWVATSTHGGSRYQVQVAGGDWTSLVYDSGWLGAVTEHVVQNLTFPGIYQVRVRYRNTVLLASLWSDPYAFQTQDVIPDFPSEPFSWDDHARMWNVTRSRYWNWPYPWGPRGSWYGPLPSAGSPLYSDYRGRLGSLGRLLGPPSAAVNTAVGPNRGANVAAFISWYSQEGGFSWERYYDCEYARGGVAALVCGTCDASDPQMAWNMWLSYGHGNWNVTADWQGITAYIEPKFAWPYNICKCWREAALGDIAYSNCDRYGTAGGELRVDVHFEGRVVKRYVYKLPFTLFFSHTSKYPECRWYPWYGVRLKVERDYDADPTGKVHLIKAMVTGAGAGHASWPDEDGPWMVEETWTGGHDESYAGAGDGGLRCGWSGYMSDRWTGAYPDNFKGHNIYKNLQVIHLDEVGCGAPCEPMVFVPEENGHDWPDPDPQPGPMLSPCPPEMPGAHLELFLGGNASPASLFRFGGYEVEEGRFIRARIRPNPVAPAGHGGQCLFKRIVVVAEHISDLTIAVTPILNGERLSRYAQEETFIGPGDRPALRRYEIPLYRAFEDAVVEGTADDRFKYGLRGTHFTFEMDVVDLCGVGLQLPGVWIEYDVVREAQGTGVVYTEDLVRLPMFVPTGQMFMGKKGLARLLKGESGVTDDGIQVEARMVCNPVAPENEDGECHFKRLSLVVTRWNANDMDLTLTPYIDGEPKLPVTIHYKATTAPVTEITEINFSDYYRRIGASAVEKMRFGLRGAWFHAKIETGSGLQEWLTLDGADLDYDVVRESLRKDVR